MPKLSKLSKAERRARQEALRDEKEYQELLEYYYKPTEYTKAMSTNTDLEDTNIANFLKREAKFNMIDKEMEEQKFKNRADTLLEETSGHETVSHRPTTPPIASRTRSRTTHKLLSN